MKESLTPFIDAISSTKTNEFFAKDTSRKIRAVNKANGERGERLTVNIPYGYKAIVLVIAVALVKHSEQNGIVFK